MNRLLISGRITYLILVTLGAFLATAGSVTRSMIVLTASATLIAAVETWKYNETDMKNSPSKRIPKSRVNPRK
jgi:hypothetical protein